VEEIIDVVKDATGALGELPARRRDQDAASITLEQLHAEQGLELEDLRAQRWLGDSASHGSLVEAEGVGHRDDVTKLPEGEIVCVRQVRLEEGTLSGLDTRLADLGFTLDAIFRPSSLARKKPANPAARASSQ